MSHSSLNHMKTCCIPYEKDSRTGVRNFPTACCTGVRNLPTYCIFTYGRYTLLCNKLQYPMVGKQFQRKGRGSLISFQLLISNQIQFQINVLQCNLMHLNAQIKGITIKCFCLFVFQRPKSITIIKPEIIFIQNRIII